MDVIGRREELATIASALDGIAMAGATLVAVEGEAGIGKTTVVEAAVARWRRPGRTVFRSKADELGTAEPFAAVATALGIRGDVTAELLLDAIAGALDDGPVVLAVDDVHWLDLASTLLLRRTLTELHDHALAVLVSLRPVPQPRELAGLLAGARPRTHVALAPMSVDELRLIVSVGGSADDLPLDQVGGNPLYTLELAAATGARRPGAMAPPLSVTILRRLSYLAPATVAVLRQAALLGAAFDLGDLVLTSGAGSGPLSGDAVLRAVEEASRAGVLRDDGSGLRLRFSHDLVHQALHDDAPSAIRRFEHRRIGRALADAGRPASVVAAHFERAATSGDQEAIEWLRRASVEVTPTSADAAIDLLRRALALRPLADERWVLIADLAIALGTSGRFEELLRFAPVELASEPPPDAAVALTTSLAQALNARGRVGEACRLLEARAIGASEAHRARLLGMLATTLLTRGDAEAARRVCVDALEASHATGNVHWWKSTLAVQAWLATGAGDVAAAVELSHRAAPGVTDEEDPVLGVFVKLALGAALLEADALAEAEATFERTISVADAAGAGANITLSHLGAGLCAYAAGRLDDAVVAAETALAIAATRGNRSSDLYAAGLLARIALHRAGPGDADAAVAAAKDLLQASGAALGAELVVWVSAVADEASGRPVDVDLVAMAWGAHPLRYLLTWRLIAPDLVRWAVAGGRLDVAASVVSDVEAVAAATAPSSSAYSGRRALATRCRALFEGAPLGDGAWETPRPLEAAAARVDGARSALSRGCREEGVDLLRAALSASSSCGATADVAGIVDLARRHHIRLEAPVRDGPGAGDALTAAERSVAALAATGLTNRAIGTQLAMSRHTVDTHLRHVYRKLGVAGRVELARRSLRDDW